MSGRQLVLWGIVPADYSEHVQRVPLKLSAGDLQHVSGEALDRLRQGWRELVAVPVGTHPRDVATCGTCGRSWDAERHPTPASLCPFCNGDEAAAAAHECYRPAWVAPTARQDDEVQPCQTLPCRCGQSSCTVPVWGAVGFARAVLRDVLPSIPAGPERDRLSDALDVLDRAGER